MAIRFFRFFALLLLAGLVLPGCASLTPKMDPPKVTLESFKSVPSDSGAPRFEIKLRVQNPNEQSLNITGISYGIELLGREVMSGVTNDVPVIEGYSEGVVSLEASIQLLQVLRLMASLGQAESDALEYRFTAKIDFSGLVPTQRIEETGQVNLK